MSAASILSFRAQDSDVLLFGTGSPLYLLSVHTADTSSPETRNGWMKLPISRSYAFKLQLHDTRQKVNVTAPNL